ncbi:oxidoreductase [Lithospermum erythrorhizon]|uniref:Oxidoreductase n=1 Tax=Lithospermum erythrorhizon TaxID=34254 RepID=A0AAV3RAR4_LITER
MAIEKSAKIFVAGHRGLVGSVVLRHLNCLGYTNLLFCTHSELDLSDQSAVSTFFTTHKPDYVILATAKVGGIHANATYPTDFLTINLQIETNVITSLVSHNVKKLVFLGSSCIYPKFAPQTIPESTLLTGPLEPLMSVVFCMEEYDGLEHVNVGSGKVVIIKELAELVKEVFRFKREIVWDGTKPDGTPRKFMDSSKLAKMGWEAKTSLRDGLVQTYKWYAENVKQ